MTWEEERKKRYRFENIYQSDVMNIDRIHPLQQKNVINVVRQMHKLDVNKVVIIGSSLNLRCNPWSDLDLVFYGDLDGFHRAHTEMRILSVKRNNISYNMSLPVWRAIFLPCQKKPDSAGFAAMQ